MGRPHIEFIFSQSLGWEACTSLAGRDGLDHKRLSHDEALGETSAILKMPAGWQASATSDFQEEIYLLDGELEIGGSRLSRDGYWRVPAGVEHSWSTDTGAVALILQNVATPLDERHLVAIDTPQMHWDRSGVPEPLAFMGIARKALFVDSDTGLHRTWLVSVAPQIAPSGVLLATETHGCAEEVFMLAGDITGPQGQMTPGAYFWRPQETFHGPYGSRAGGLALSRFRHGPQTTTFHDRTLPFDFEAPYRPDLPAELAHLSAAGPPDMARY